MTINDAAADSYSGLLGGSGANQNNLALTTTGAGTVTLGGANTYTGQTTVTGGSTVSVSVLGNSGETSSSIGAATGTNRNLILGTGNTNGSLTYTGAATSTDHVLDITNSTGGDIISSSGSGKLTLTGGVIGNHTMFFGGTQTAEETGAITANAGTVNFNGTNTWILSGANTYTEATTITVRGHACKTGNATATDADQPAAALQHRDNGVGLPDLSANAAVSKAISGTGSVSLIPGNTAAVSLSAANTYTGPTSINAGQLTLTTGSLGGTAVTVGNGTSGSPILLISSNYTIGTATAGSLTITGSTSGNGQGTFSMVSGAPNTLTLANNTAGATTLTIGGATGNAVLNMEVGATADEISLAATALASVGASSTANVINITGLGGLTGTPQVLINAPAGLASGSFSNFTLGTISGNTSGYTLGLNATSTQLQLTETLIATPASAYWSGAVSSVWNTFSGVNNTNWRTDATSNVDTNQIPGSTTNVFFYTTNPAATNLTNTLGQNFTINSLNYTTAATSSVTIAAGNTLTINAANAYGSNPAGTGITLASGAAAQTINAPLTLGGAQTWLNASANPLTVGGALSGSVVLTLSSSGTGGFVLSGASTGFTGGLTVTAGTLTGTTSANAFGANASTITLGDSVADASNVTLLGDSRTFANPIVLANIATATGTLTIGSTGANTPTFSGGVTGTNNLTLNVSGTGKLTLATGSINNSGTLTNAGTGTGGVTISAVIGANVTGVVQNSASSTMTLSGPNAYTNTSPGTGTTITAGTLIITSDGNLGAVPGSASTDVLINGGTLEANAGFTLNPLRGIALGASATSQIVANNGVFTYTGVIANQSGADSLTIASGAGIWNPGGQYTYSGGTTLASGSTSVAATSSTGPAGGSHQRPLRHGNTDSGWRRDSSQHWGQLHHCQPRDDFRGNHVPDRLNPDPHFFRTGNARRHGDAHAAIRRQDRLFRSDRRRRQRFRPGPGEREHRDAGPRRREYVHGWFDDPGRHDFRHHQQQRIWRRGHRHGHARRFGRGRQQCDPLGRRPHVRQPDRAGQYRQCHRHAHHRRVDHYCGDLQRRCDRNQQPGAQQPRRRQPAHVHYRLTEQFRHDYQRELRHRHRVDQRYHRQQRDERN